MQALSRSSISLSRHSISTLETNPFRMGKNTTPALTKKQLKSIAKRAKQSANDKQRNLAAVVAAQPQDIEEAPAPSNLLKVLPASQEGTSTPPCYDTPARVSEASGSGDETGAISASTDVSDAEKCSDNQEFTSSSVHSIPFVDNPAMPLAALVNTEEDSPVSSRASTRHVNTAARVVAAGLVFITLPSITMGACAFAGCGIAVELARGFWNRRS